MTVRELIDALSNYDDDLEVLVAEHNGWTVGYASEINCDSFDDETYGLRAFWGDDRTDILTIILSEQVGALWTREELREVNDFNEEDDE